MDLDIDDEKSLRCFTPGGGAVKTLSATPLQLAHNLINNTDSGVHSQQSLKSVKIEILQPEVKGWLISKGILVSILSSILNLIWTVYLEGKLQSRLKLKVCFAS